MAEEVKHEPQDVSSQVVPETPTAVSSDQQESHPHQEKQSPKAKKEKHHEEQRVEQLKKEIEKLSEEKTNLEDAYKRKVAEFDNYKKRVAREMEDMRVASNKRLLQHILPVYDNLFRALQTIESSTIENLKQGLSIIYAEFTKVMEDAGVRPIECVGQEFDYSRHEALMMEERADVPFPMTVVQELERGYMLGSEVLRPSKVKVAKKVVSQAEQASDAADTGQEKNQEKE